MYKNRINPLNQCQLLGHKEGFNGIISLLFFRIKYARFAITTQGHINARQEFVELEKHHEQTICSQR